MFPACLVIVLATRSAGAIAAAPADAPVEPPPFEASEPQSDPSAPTEPATEPTEPTDPSDPGEPTEPTDEPEPTPEPEPPADDATVPPIEPVKRPPTKPVTAEPPTRTRKWPEPLRKGGTLLVSTGVAGCGQTVCKPIKAAGWASISGGYRFGRFAPIVMIAGGGTPARAPSTIQDPDGNTYGVTSANSSLGFFYSGAGTLLHLLQSTNFDPWFGLTVGYMQTRERLTARASSAMGNFSTDFKRVTHRGAIGLQLGIGFRILKRFTLGPRFDFLLPFAGRVCVHGSDTNGCEKISDYADRLGIDPGESFPRLWMVTLQAGFVL